MFSGTEPNKSQAEHPARQMPAWSPASCGPAHTGPDSAGFPSAWECTLLHTTLFTLHNRLPCLSVPLLWNAPCCKHSSFFHHWGQAAHIIVNIFTIIQHPPLKLQPLWSVSPSLTDDKAKSRLILRHGNYPRNPPLPTRDSPGTARTKLRRRVSGFLPQQVG